MSQLTDKQRLMLSSAGFTDREISLYRQKFHNLLNTQPVFGFDAMKNLVGFRDQRNDLLEVLEGVAAAMGQGISPSLKDVKSAIARVKS